MLLVSHIIVALAGLVLAAICYFKPALSKIRILCATTTFTLVSGSVLVVKLHSSLTSACLSGLLYLGVIMVSIILSYRKLAKVHIVS